LDERLGQVGDPEDVALLAGVLAAEDGEGDGAGLLLALLEYAPRLGGGALEPRLDLIVEALEHERPRLRHALVDLALHLGAQGGEGGVDLLLAPARLVDVEDAALEVDAGVEGAEHLVRRA